MELADAPNSKSGDRKPVMVSTAFSGTNLPHHCRSRFWTKLLGASVTQPASNFSWLDDASIREGTLVGTKAMPDLVYFDTDVFHRIGETFHDKPLAAELRDRILLSPITFIEVLSHLTLKRSGGDVLKHIQAVHNWVNPKNARLLPWPTIAIAKAGFQKTLPDDGSIVRIEKTINVCLGTDSVEELRESAGKLKDALDRMKDSTAQDFKRLVEDHVPALRRHHFLGIGRLES